jgi:hypothetical protein
VKKQISIQSSRRKFISQVSIAGAATVAAATIPLEPLFGTQKSVAKAANGNSGAVNRANDCFNYRKNMAQAQKINVGVQPDNGDASRFTDSSGSYSKALLHDSLGVPNAAAFASMRTAFNTGKTADFANIIVGTPGGGGNSKLNGPQGSLAFDLEGIDSHCTIIPPFTECSQRANCRGTG